MSCVCVCVDSLVSCVLFIASCTLQGESLREYILSLGWIVVLDTLNAVCASRTRLSHLGLEEFGLGRYVVVIDRY